MSCLFNSLSYFIKEDSYVIRNKICDYLEQNNKIIDGLETQFIINLDSNNYVENMRNQSTWGGAIEIQVACNIWSLRIIVHNYRDKDTTTNNKIEFIPINNGIKNIDNTDMNQSFSVDSSLFSGIQFLKENTIELYWTGGHYEPIKI